MRCHLDFETRSEIDIWKSGAWIYAAHPSTSIQCVAYAVDNGPVELIDQDDLQVGRFDELMALANNPEVLFVAHNAYFERSIWKNIMEPMGFPPVNVRRFRCTQAKALAYGLPKGLEKSANALGAEQRKDKTGRQIMLRMCKPLPNKKGEIIYDEDPKNYETLYEYCRQDVRVERDLDTALPDLSDAEQEIWFYDQLINTRGVQVDMPTVKKFINILEAKTNSLNKELVALTAGAITKGTQVASMLKFLNAGGAAMTSLNKQSVADAIKEGLLTKDQIQILRLRQQLGKSSLAKYAKLVAAVDDQGVLRDSYVYHGASTGRWGGKLVQLQNLPKNKAEVDTDVAINNLVTYGYPAVEMIYPGNLMEVLSSCIRGMFIPVPGKEMYVVDYGAIEARVVMWLSGEAQGLKEFEATDRGTDEDIYVKMAQRIYNNSNLTKANNPGERQLGKQAILGCIAEGSMVYSDTGFIPIEKLNQEQRLWDGERWVNFQERVKTGWKSVIQIEDLWLTPDHILLTKEGWQTAGEIVLKGDMERLTLGPYLGDGRLLGLNIKKVRNAMSLCAVNAVLKKVEESINSGEAKQMLADNVTRVLQENVEDAEVDTLILSLIHVYGKNGVSAGTILNEGVLTQITRTTKGMVLEAFQWASNPVEYSWNILLNLITGTNGAIPSIELIMPKGTPLEILGLLHKGRTISTKEMVCYDIVGAETQSFQVGDFIAHNCGYGMGAPKFQATCAGYGIQISEPDAKRIVDLYRSTYFNVKNYWTDMERTVLNAYQNPGKPQDLGNVRWIYIKEREAVFCKLPSGRILTYLEPEMVENKFGGMSLSFMTEVTSQWVRRDTYGGLLVENITQAVARDIMAYRMPDLEAAGFPTLMHTHDEIVSERASGEAKLQEMIDIMCEVPSWAVECPIVAEGFLCQRYKKE